MIIKEVRAYTLKIPLEQTIYIGNLVIRHRDYVFVEIETDDGLKGHGFGFARDGRVSDCVTTNLRPLLIGREALLVERIWDDLYRSTRYLGRKGMMMRAISAVDIALWDLKGKKAGLPIWAMLGGMSRQVPAYVAGGYYRDGDGLEAIDREYAAYRDAGYHGAKMKVGAASFRDDLQRVERARKALGDRIALMVDFNGVLQTAKEALRFAERLKPYDIAFIEEPFLMDNLPAMREFRAATAIPVAIGEDESGRWAFRELLQQETLDILRHDATLVGGISEWVKVTHLGLAYGKPIYPHWFPEVHIHLAAAFPDCMGVELIPPESRIMNFHRLVRNPVTQKDGYAEAPEEPGLGLDWNWDVIESSIEK